MNKEIVEWRENTGIALIKKSHVDILKETMQVEPSVLSQITMRKFDEYMLVLSNYYVYLQSELGILIARVDYLQEAFDNAVAVKASKYGASHAGERRAIAVSKDEGLAKLQEQVRKEKTKLEMLRPINEGMRQKMFVLSRVFERRMKNEH